MKVKKTFNIGMAFLRIYLSFLVVTSHCFIPNGATRKKIILKIIRNNIHVPIFYILSFYFCYKLFKSKDIIKIKIRFQRLLIPYFIWPIIIWSLHYLLSFLFIKINKISFQILILQLLTGHAFMLVFWFQYDLILITVLIVIIHLLFNEKFILYILINLKFFGIFFTYSNINYILFFKYNFNKRYTFGRIFEVIPYCITGYILASLSLVYYLSQHIIISINIILFLLILIIKYNIFLEINGFLYQGLKLYAISISIFFIFSLFPTKRIGNYYIIKFIKFISTYTAGIYFIHIPLYDFLCIFSLIKNGELIGAIITYVMSFFISLFGKLIFKNTKLINLFQ